MIKRESIAGLIIIVLFAISLMVHRQPPASSPDAGISSPAFFPKDGIAVLDLFGPLSFPQFNNSFVPSGAHLVLNQLTQIEKDSHVKGLIVRINSPGGTVGASQEIYQALQRIKASRNIPIFAQIGDIGASGAYYAALGADTIYANSGSLVGSIGVIMGNLSIERFGDQYGIDYQVYKSGEYKDLLSMWRPPSNAEKQLLQGVIDDVYLQFQAALIDSRKFSKRHAESVSQGQIYTGNQALELDLIDTVGTYHDALTAIGELTGLGKTPHIISKSYYHWTDFMTVINSKWNTSFFTQFTSIPELR